MSKRNRSGSTPWYAVHAQVYSDLFTYHCSDFVFCFLFFFLRIFLCFPLSLAYTLKLKIVSVVFTWRQYNHGIKFSSWNLRVFCPLTLEESMWLQYSGCSSYWENMLAIFRCKGFLLSSDPAGTHHWQKSAPNWTAVSERLGESLESFKMLINTGGGGGDTKL